MNSNLGDCINFWKVMLEEIETRNNLEIHDSYDNIISYAMRMFRNDLKTLETLNNLIAEKSDTVTCYLILRCLYDRLCVFNLIYINPTENEDNKGVYMMIRHYLYVIDGLKQQEKVVSAAMNILQSDGACGTIDYLPGIHKEIDLCYRKLDNIIQSNGIAINQKIRKGNLWRFMRLSDKGQYNWETLHQRIFGTSYYETFSQGYLSQYVHGLFVSNVKDHNEASFAFIKGNALKILDKFVEYTEVFFKTKKEYYSVAFLEYKKNLGS